MFCTKEYPVQLLPDYKFEQRIEYRSLYTSICRAGTRERMASIQGIKYVQTEFKEQVSEAVTVGSGDLYF
jgi:hypothetical protein